MERIINEEASNVVSSELWHSALQQVAAANETVTTTTHSGISSAAINGAIDIAAPLQDDHGGVSVSPMSEAVPASYICCLGQAIANKNGNSKKPLTKASSACVCCGLASTQEKAVQLFLGRPVVHSITSSPNTSSACGCGSDCHPSSHYGDDSLLHYRCVQ